MPLTKQNKQPLCGISRKCWLYLSLILVSVTVITIVSSYAPNEKLDDQATNPTLSDAQKLLGHKAIKMMTTNINDLEFRTQTPVIGILTEVLRDYKKFGTHHKLHIAASYVKWIESSGAQVVPILLNQNDFYYEQMFKQTNGLLFPGGDNLLDPTKNTPMMVAARKLYKMAVEANDRGEFYPIWGTCLGLELLSVLSSNKNVLEPCSAVDEALPVKFVERGRMFAPSSYANMPELNKDYSGVIMDIMTKKNTTYNHHYKCLSDEGLEKAGLKDFYRPIAYSFDKNNKKFITIMEAINYPFYATMAHAEKPSFEFVVKPKQMNIPHLREAIAVSRYLGDFFVEQCRYSCHSIDRELIENQLIYAYHPSYTAHMNNDIYEMRYMFPFGNDMGASIEEFINHVPRDDEVIPEDVTRSDDEEVWSYRGPLTVDNLDMVHPKMLQRDLYVVGTNNTMSR